MKDLIIKPVCSNLSQEPDLFDLTTSKGNVIKTFNSLEQAKKEKKRWVLIDPDTDQWVNKISETSFEVFEAGDICFIDLDDYTEERLEYYTSAFYSSLKELREIYGDSSNQIIAECIAEIENS